MCGATRANVYVFMIVCTHTHTHIRRCVRCRAFGRAPFGRGVCAQEWESGKDQGYVSVCVCVCLCIFVCVFLCVCLCLCVYVCVTRERESVCGCMFGCLYVHVRWYRRKQMLIFTHVSLSYDNALNTHTSIHVYLYTYTGLIHPYVVSLVDQTSGKQTQARQVCRSVCVCVYVCWCVCVYKYVAVCMYVCMCVFRSVIHTYTHISTCVYR
jgi:hypothetical protein